MFDVTLPSGKVVNIKSPTYQDRMDAVKEIKPVQREVGYTVEELMAAKAILAVDSKKLTEQEKLFVDPINIMAPWGTIDAQYFVEFYMSAFFPEPKLIEKAQAEAKKLMGGSGEATLPK